MSSTKNPADHRSVTSAAGKRRFLIRMVTVLIGGMVLDGYV
jgi:putative MFS transporter